MASIQATIAMQDGVTNVLDNIIAAVNLTVRSMGDLAGAMNTSIDTSSLEGTRELLNDASIAANKLQASLSNIKSPDAGASVATSAPISWESSGMEVFNATGAERFKQEIASANSMMNTLIDTQRQISANTANVALFPPEATGDIEKVQSRLQDIQQRVALIEKNKINMTSPAANAQLEYLRGQLNNAVKSQNNLNSAVKNMDMGGANREYLQLSQTIDGVDRYIRDNTNAQGEFNRTIDAGTAKSNGLVDKIKGVAAAYVGVQGAKAVINMADTLTSTTARLNLMNDGLQKTDELQQMIFESAERSRGSYQATADAVSKLGLMAGDAFSSNEEIVDFMEQINKQFTIAGTEASGIDAAMLQLTQAMGSGILRGEEYNSILEQAPNIIENIANYMNVPKGKLKDMAAEGEITAQIVKEAMFAAAEQTDERFNNMPMTFAQTWQSFKNNALMAFQSVLSMISKIGSSAAFQSFVSTGIAMIQRLANAIETAFNIAGSVGRAISQMAAFRNAVSMVSSAITSLGNMGNWVAGNLSVIAPVILSIVGALGVYGAYLGILRAQQIMCAAASAAHVAVEAASTVAMNAKIAIMAAVKGQTMAATAAQIGYNGALYACPLVWIIGLFVALVAIIAVVCNVIAKMTGIAGSGLGVMVGAISVVIAWFKNMFAVIGNIAAGIWNVMGAVASNMETAFNNAILSIQSWFYNLLSDVLTVVSGICAALNKLPFVSFDYSGITNAASDYAGKAAEAEANKGTYQSIEDAFNAGNTTFDAFKDGWKDEAFASGAALGDGLMDKVSGMFNWDFGSGDAGSLGSLSSASSTGDAVRDIANNTGSTADSAGSIADSMEITEEELKYMRDIAEQEAINRFTTAEITIEQTNNNNVSSDMGLDGIVSGLTDAVKEAVDIIAEGVHV